MGKFSLACVALLVLQPVHAQSVYKCVDVGGNVSYQSAPCRVGQQVTATYAATPDPPQRQVYSSSSSSFSSTTTQQTTNVSPSSDASTDRTVRRAQCNAAKARREQVLESVGLSRTFDLLRQLDESVYEACKGL